MKVGEGKAAALRISWECELAEIGELLHKKRDTLGLTQEQMAQMIGVHQSRISRVERGLGTPKDYPTAEAYALCYRLDNQERNTWFELLFGIAQSPHDQSVSQLSVIDHMSPPSGHELAMDWESVVGAHLISTAESLQEYLLWAEAIPLFRKAEAFSGVTPQAARAGCSTAHMYVELGDYDTALREILRVQATYAAVLDLGIEMELYRTRGWIDYEQGNFPTAVTWFNQCLRIAAASGIEQLSTHAHHFLGRVYCDWGQTVTRRQQAAAWFQKAGEEFDTAYRLHHIWGDQGDLAYDLFRKAQLFQVQGQWREAQHLRDRARSLSGKELIALNIDLEETLLALRNGGEQVIPFSQVENALQGWAQVKRTKGIADALHILALGHCLQGKLGQALELYVAALCVYPFEQHLDNRTRWRELHVIVNEIIREYDRGYYERLVDQLREQAANRQRYFAYLDHVVADRQIDIARIFGNLRTMGLQKKSV